MGMTEFQTAALPGLCFGSRSTTAAEIADSSVPAAMPWRTRATMRPETDVACQNSTRLTASSAKTPEITGRRPT